MGEIGITGGEEDGVDNSGVKAESLYTTPQQVFKVHQALSPISPMFSIAAAFGNVHGVYKAGNVVLSPKLLKGHQDFAKEQLKCSEDSTKRTKATCRARLATPTVQTSPTRSSTTPGSGSGRPRNL